MNGGRESKPANIPERYRVADLLVDAGRQCVKRGEAEIPLPKLSFDLLLALVRAAPNVLSHDELMAQVWPRLIVSPETLSQRVKLLRDALGDDPREPRYVAALRGRGYRLLPDVEPIGYEPVPSVPPVPPVEPATAEPAPAAVVPGAGRPPPPTRETRWRLALVTMTVLAVIGIVILFGRTMREPPRTEPDVPSTVTVTALPSRTVAVMPFKHLSPNPQDEFVALGIAEGVLHRLAGIRELTVIARTSSFAIDEQRTDARDIGLTLNARYLVEGSVQRAGDRLRVTAQLIDATTGTHVRSLRFDRTMEDIFALEDEISDSVARALQVSLNADEHPFARFGTDAYLAFMQGRALMATRKQSDAELAVERFSRALALAPQSAAAHAALAEAHIFRAMVTAPERTPVDEREHLATLRTTAESLLTRALELDATLGEAYVWRAWLKMGGGDTPGALADYEKGVALSPSYAPGLQMYGEELHGLGRDAEAVTLIDRARLIDPLYPRSHYYKGLMVIEDSLEDAETLFLQALAVAPDFHPALMRVGTIRWLTGRFAEAAKYAEQAVAVDPRALWLRIDLSTLYLDLGDLDAARHVIAEAGAAPRAWVPICLYSNDLARARGLLQDALDPQTIIPAQDQLVPFVIRAVRDQALASGDHGAANSIMRAVAESMDPALGKGTTGYAPFLAFQFDQTLVAAQWRKSIGEQRSAEASADAVLQALDQLPETAARAADRFTRSRALALAILGRHDAAIAALEDAFATTARMRWWYDLDREPAFAELRKDGRFQMLAEQVRGHAAAQRQLLDEMRQRGEIPDRAARPRSGAC